MIEAITNFHFIRPYFLLLLIPLLFIKVINYMSANKISIWNKVVDNNLLPHLFIKRRNNSSKLLIIIWVLLVLSLSGPVWQKNQQGLYNSTIPTVIILDASLSMNAVDIAPSRMARSIIKIYDILNQNKGGLFSLMIYSEEPYVIVPLSDDNAIIENYLPLITTDIMPSQGSRLDRAIELATHELNKSNVNAAHIVILTDSAGHSDIDKVLTQAKNAENSGYIISIIGAGTNDGGMINLENGNKIKTKLNQEELIEIVKTSKGKYHQITNDDKDIKYIFSEIEDRIKRLNPLVKSDIDSLMWQDSGIYFLIPVLILFPLLFRKNFLFSIGIILFPVSANAFDYREWFLSPEQYGVLLIEEGDFNKAEKYLINNKEQRSIALLNANRIEDVKVILANEKNFNTLYNIGTVLAQKGEYNIALSLLERAVSINPKSMDALNNYLVVKKILEQEAPNSGDRADGNDGSNNDSEMQNSPPNNQNKDESQQKQELQKQKIDTSKISENNQDMVDMLKNKLKRIYDKNRYGEVGEENRW